VTAGAGHRRAAEAIAQAAAGAFPDAEIECRDLLDDVPGWLRRGYPATYYVLVRHCGWLWGKGFQGLDQHWLYALAQPLRHAWNLSVARRFIRRLRAWQPDLVIVTHFFPADVVGACRAGRWLRAPLIVAVTDLHPHRFWLSAKADAYIVGTEEGAAAARARGVAAERLHVLGIPVTSAVHADVDRRALQRRFHLAPERLTVLVTSGGNIVGPFEPAVEALMALERDVPKRLQLLVVCGDAAPAARRLAARARAAAMPVQVFGFVDIMPEFMAVSDLVVTKAGGVTVAEALGRGLPLVFYHVIPGQEWSNALHVSRRGAAVLAPTPQETAQAVRQCLEQPTLLARMREAALELGAPDAAQAIIERVAKPLLASKRPS
jgi:processive 1,2-diacylglycerol beta-glucosyltransferase